MNTKIYQLSTAASTVFFLGRFCVCLSYFEPIFEKNYQLFQKKLPIFQKKLPIFQKNLPSFQKNLPSFQKIYQVFKKLPTFSIFLPMLSK